jgi:hypothetical protein
VSRSPSEVYEPVIAAKIRVKDECWIWTGGVRQPHGYPWYRGRRVISLATKHKNVENTCRNTMCLNPEHYVHTYSEVGRIAFIEHNVNQVGGCLEWKGHLKTSGVPGMYYEYRGKLHRDFPVRRINWCVEYLPPGHDWPEGTFGVNCGNPSCVRVEHIDAILIPDTGCKCVWSPGRHHNRFSVQEYTGDTDSLPLVSKRRKARVS